MRFCIFQDVPVNSQAPKLLEDIPEVVNCLIP